jgi:hypothetical protein
MVHSVPDDGRSESNHKEHAITNQLFTGLTTKSLFSVTKAFCFAMSRQCILSRRYMSFAEVFYQTDLRSILETVVLFL